MIHQNNSAVVDGYATREDGDMEDRSYTGICRFDIESSQAASLLWPTIDFIATV